VQGVNLQDDQADALLRQFRFLPDARLDDLMVSFATDGGGVGPHFDSYDVFLLQAEGQRRWKISAQKDLTLVEGLPLKILKKFKASEEFVLEPGDMLYLPPHYAHDGEAVGDCQTYSRNWAKPSCNSWPIPSTCRAAMPIPTWNRAASQPKFPKPCSRNWPMN
jgi:50S ribosomal protein L16 3-hydroxylase